MPKLVRAAGTTEVRLGGSREPIPGRVVAAIAAALAAYLEAEAAGGRPFRILDVRRAEVAPGPPVVAQAAWGLAGRLELMAARGALNLRRAGGRQGVEAR